MDVKDNHIQYRNMKACHEIVDNVKNDITVKSFISTNYYNSSHFHLILFFLVVTKLVVMIVVVFQIHMLDFTKINVLYINK